MGFVEMMNTQKTLAAAALIAAAGTAFAQVGPGAITPDLTEDYEGTPGARVILSSLFGGLVPVIAGTVTHNSVDFGNWSDFRIPGGPIQPTSGTKFGVGFGFGDFTLDFTGVGGITGIEMNASAAGVGADIIEFFDMAGNLLGGTVTDPDGFGPGDGTMEFLSFSSTVTIGSIRLTGRESTYDDIGIATDPSFCEVSENDFTPVATEDYEGTPGARVVLNDLFGGDVPVIAGSVTHNSVDAGGWSDFRLPGGPIQPTSGTKFGVGFGFGDFTLDFTSIGGVDGFQGQASAAGVGDDVVTFFDMDGNELCSFTIVGGFGPGDGTMVPFSYTSITKIGSVRLTGRESAYDDLGILQPPPPPPPGSQVFVFTGGDVKPILDNAAAQAGITPDLRIADSDFLGLTNALNNPDFGVAIISNPCCFFDAGTPGALDTFVNNGNTAHMSFWNMDAEPGLRGTFGVASAVDFFAQRPVFSHVAHPSWGGISDVPVDPAPSPWFDIGDDMTPAAGGTVVGTFDFAGGPGAIIVANDDRTLFNGFAYDTSDTTAVTDLVAAQLGWIPKPGASCRADIDGDGALTLFDFLEFQNLFAMGDLRADFDDDGALTLFDFLEFQNQFALGCE